MFYFKFVCILFSAELRFLFFPFRFTQLNDKWSYDKSENLSIEELLSDRFTHLLIEAGTDETSLALSNRLEKSHEVLQEVSAFNGLEINTKQFPGFSIRKKKALSIVIRK